MGFFGNGNLRSEVEDLLREIEEQQRGETAQNQEKFSQLNQKIDRLVHRIDELEDVITQLKGQLVPLPQNENLSKVPVQQQTVAQSNVNPVSVCPRNPVKLIYTGFNQGVFTVPMRLGVGEQWLSNPKANFVLECEKGQNEGIFYPNPANLKVLAFNAQSNLNPICDIVSGPSESVVKPGVVVLDSATNGWKVTQKCQIAL